MKERPILFSPPMVRAIVDGAKVVTRRVATAPRWAVPGTLERDGGGLAAVSRKTGCLAAVPCPHGVPGDRLYVAEAWSTPPGFGDWRTTDRSAILYTSTDTIPEGWKRRHARFMPRKYARIVLEVLSASPWWLHDIGDTDAVLEGVAFFEPGTAWGPREKFAALWAMINGSESWAANPLVWRVGFKVVEVRHV